MNNYKEVFNNFKDIQTSYEAHNQAIKKFRDNKSRAVLAITSIQGSGKTTAIIDAFAESKDDILLTQSNKKLEEIVELIHDRHPNLNFHVIWGLEQSCATYQADDDIKDEVNRYRKIGIQTADIHRLICDDS